MTHAASDWIALFSADAQLSMWHMRGAERVSTSGAAELPSDTPVVGCCFGKTAPRDVPCSPLADTLTAERVEGRQMHLVAPLRNASPLHLTGGAELEIAGFVDQTPDFDGVLCIPGQITVWAHISAEEIVSFQSFATGQLAAGLGAAGVSRLNETTLSDIMARPERLAGMIASAQVSDDQTQIASALIGAEMAATRPYWLGQQVALIEGGALSALYKAAITAQGLPAVEANAEEMRIAGLWAARQRIPG